MKSLIMGERFIQALVDAGVVPQAATKVIIEAAVQDVVRIHYTLLGDESLLEVVPAAAEAAVIKESNWKKIGGRLLWRSESPSAPL